MKKDIEYVEDKSLSYMKKSPVISVVMSVFNETEEQLDRSITSILSQSFSDFEFIIVNDNPENESIGKILEKYTDKRIRLIKNKKNIGLTFSLNKAIEASSGEFIARMDADDCSLKNRLQYQLKYLKDNDLDLLGSFIYVADESGKIYLKKGFPVHRKVISVYLRFENVLAHPTWLVRKRVYEDVGLYRNIPFCEDYDFLLRANKKNYRIGNIPEYLFNYTKRKNSITESSGEKHFYNSLVLQMHYSDLENFNEVRFSEYLSSKEYICLIDELKEYQALMLSIRDEKSFKKKVYSVFRVLKNRFFYRFAYGTTVKKTLNLIDRVR